MNKHSKFGRKADAADQRPIETQESTVGGDKSGRKAGGGGHHGRETQRGPAATDNKMSVAERGRLAFDRMAANDGPGHRSDETHGASAVAAKPSRTRRQSSSGTQEGHAAGNGASDSQTHSGTQAARAVARKPTRRHAAIETHVRHAADSGTGQDRPETQERRAGAATTSDDHATIETQRGNVVGSGEGGHQNVEPHGGTAALADIIAEVRMYHRRRRRWHRAEKSLTLQCFAACWSSLGGGTETKAAATKLLRSVEDGDVAADSDAALTCMPLLAARGMIRDQRLAVEKTLEKLAKQLPVWPWVESIYGIGALSLSAVVGEAGDVGSYRTVSGLWKRMGLAVIDGGRQRMVAGDEALKHGYSPSRRSVMWNIGGGLIGGMGKGPRPGVDEDMAVREDLSPYQKLFVERLRYEAERDPDAHRKEPVVNTKTGELRESFSAHAANRAKRYVEKRFLRELFAAWRRAIDDTKPKRAAPAASPIPASAGAERHHVGETHPPRALGNPSSVAKPAATPDRQARLPRTANGRDRCETQTMPAIGQAPDAKGRTKPKRPTRRAPQPRRASP